MMMTIDRISSKKNLTDEDILFIISILTKCKSFTSNDLYVIDTLSLTSFMNKIQMKDISKTDQRLVSVFKDFFSEKRGYKIIVIPLFNQYHWSLAIYIRIFGTIIHFDSIEGFHEDYFIKLKKILKYHKIVKLRNIFHGLEEKSIKTNKQIGSWECGYFMLMYYYVFISYFEKYNCNIDDTSYLLFIKNMTMTINMICKQENIDSFVNALTKIININLNSHVFKQIYSNKDKDK
jgi:hypothetical protein